MEFFTASQRVWLEVEYRIDLCCVTRGAQIEYL